MGDFRDYENPARSTVKELYRLNHRHQTVDFVRKKKKEYLSLDRREMTMWEAFELHNTLVDDSDPDTDVSQTGVWCILPNADVLYPLRRSISATVETVFGRTDVLPGIDVATSPTEPISAE